MCRRSAAVVVALGLALVLLAACGGDALPPEITVEHVVAELAPPLGPDVVIEGPGGVARAELEPGERAHHGGPRDAVAAPPGSVLRLPVTVPPDAALRFVVGVAGDKQRDTSRSGIEFRVGIDGREMFTEVLNPSNTRRHRRWVGGRVDLRPWAGRTVTVALETRAEQPDRPPAGTPGWAQLRVVREARRRRQGAGEGPNVLVLLVDALRADRLGVYGAGPAATPTLDALAASGVVFDVAVAQSSWTMPAVASIFTGLHPRSHGAVGPDVHEADGRSGSGTLLAEAAVTLAELAADAGISTVGVSSNMLVGEGTNLAQGFETFIELPFDQQTRDYVPATTVHRAFLDWLAGASGARFFAYLHYMEPHGPYAPPAPLRPAVPPGLRQDLAAGWVQDFARAFDHGRVAAPSPAEVEPLRRLYDGDVRSWDDQLPVLLRGLDAAGVRENTIVVVVADHGEEFMEHGRLAHGAHLYEETVRIPLVVAGGGLAPRRRTDQAQQIDLLPTIAAWLGVAPPAGLPGRDLFATDVAGDAISEIVSGFGDAGAGRATVALRTPGWKLIRAPEPAPLELYDLTRDPGERTNVAEAAAGVAALAGRLDRWAASTPPPPRTAAAGAGMRERLRQLGYVD